MPPSRSGGAARGRWGEDVAAESLRAEGYEIVERNARPCRADRRLEIDIVAYDPRSDAIVFVEVKQHARHLARESRLRSIDGRKTRLLRRAFRAWIACNRWTGARRFDVVEVYGEPHGRSRPEVDHIERVRLFEGRGRFVNWAD